MFRAAALIDGSAWPGGGTDARPPSHADVTAAALLRALRGVKATPTGQVGPSGVKQFVLGRS